MKFNTARYKIKAAKFFLQKIKESYNEEGYYVDFYLDAMLVSCRSVIDFMNSDFLYHVEPKLTSREKRLIQKRHRMDQEHPQKDAVNNFLESIWQDFTKFKNETHMRCYFFEKRNISTHSEPTVRGGGTFTKTPDGKTIFDKHCLESQLEVNMERTSGRELIDIGNCTLTGEQREKLLEQLSEEDMRSFLDSLVNDVENFVNDMEKKYCEEDV